MVLLEINVELVTRSGGSGGGGGGVRSEEHMSEWVFKLLIHGLKGGVLPCFGLLAFYPSWASKSLCPFDSLQNGFVVSLGFVCFGLKLGGQLNKKKI